MNIYISKLIQKIIFIQFLLLLSFILAKPTYASVCSDFKITPNIGSEGEIILIDTSIANIDFSFKIDRPLWASHYFGIQFDNGQNNLFNKDYVKAIQVINSSINGSVSKSEYSSSFKESWGAHYTLHEIKVKYLGQQSKSPNDIVNQPFIETRDCKYNYKIINQSAAPKSVEELYKSCSITAYLQNDLGVGKPVRVLVKGIPRQIDGRGSSTPYIELSDLMLYKENSFAFFFDPRDDSAAVASLGEGDNNLIIIDGSKFDEEKNYHVKIRDRRGLFPGYLDYTLINKQGCFLVIDLKNKTITTPPPSPFSTPFTPNIMDLCKQVSAEKQEECKTCLGTGRMWTALGCMKTDISGFVESLFKIGLGIAGGLALLFIIYGGFMIMTSGGSEEAVKQGKDVLTSAITGLLLIIFSVLLLQLISVDILKIPGFAQTTTSVCPDPTRPKSCGKGVCCMPAEICAFQADPYCATPPPPTPTFTPAPTLIPSPTPTITITPTPTPANCIRKRVTSGGCNPTMFPCPTDKPICQEITVNPDGSSIIQCCP